MSALRLRHLSTAVRTEAVQWTGDNADEIRAFCGENVQIVGGSLSVRLPGSQWWGYVRRGHYLVRDVYGEPFMLHPDVLSETYEVLP